MEKKRRRRRRRRRGPKEKHLKTAFLPFSFLFSLHEKEREGGEKGDGMLPEMNNYERIVVLTVQENLFLNKLGSA